MTPSLATIYDYLVEVAEAARPCPTNEQIALATGVRETSTVSYRISCLKSRGFIKVSFGHWGRQVHICGTKAHTAKQRVHSGGQTHRVDSKRFKERRALPEKEEEQPYHGGLLGMSPWTHDWEAGLDETEKWLAGALSEMG